MEKAATATALRQAFATHRSTTAGHVTRLEKVFGLLNEKPIGKKCMAMEGITKEGGEIIGSTKRGSETRDVALIFAAQKVEHYEIASYGCLAELARTLYLKEIPEILEETLAEEKEADKTLTALAVKSINEQASLEQGESVRVIDKVLSYLGG